MKVGEVGPIERGSLIVFKQEKYVVLSVHRDVYLCVKYEEDGSLIVGRDFGFHVDNEVDVCFPGPVVELPWFVK